MVREDIFVRTLEEYIGQIIKLKKMDEKDKNILWFRGHRNYQWALIPQLYRGIKENCSISDSVYTLMNLREDMRQQQNYAKNYQFLKNDNLNPIEWMAIAQHHGVKTRMLDWSTSAIHALLFALEDRFTQSCELKKEKELPCVWCLYPQSMNKYTVTEVLTEKKNYLKIKKLIESHEKGNIVERKNFIKSEPPHFMFESGEKEDEHLNYLYNLAYFEELFASVERDSLSICENLLLNPLYYILDKIYGRGIGIRELRLFPLAIVHPYHSERIRAQQGTFTIFPNYITKEQEDFSDIMDMRHQPGLEKCLRRIIIRYPDRIAKELMAIGAHRSWLYPEEPIVSQEIETGL